MTGQVAGGGVRRGVFRAALAAAPLWVAVAGRALVATDGPGPADVVLVHAGDPRGRRVMAGVEAFRASGARRLVVFIDHAGPVYDPREDLLAYVRSRGIPGESIRLVGPVATTAEEAASAAALARRCGWRSVLAVTSLYHTRRARWTLRRALGRHAEVRMMAADEPLRPWLWWAAERDTAAVFLEWAKAAASLRYLFRRPRERDPGMPC